MMPKIKRQQKIRELIQKQRIATQDELSELLVRAGFGATQSSISRDLVELGVSKISGIYALAKNAKPIQGLISMENAGANLIVAKCEAGLASAVAVRIDREGIREIVGTVAGDDTILIAVKDAKGQQAARNKIRKIFER
jgi:transcriptional regulator of arginine metabolism